MHFTLIALLFLAAPALAQPTGRIAGTVADSLSGEPLLGVHIAVAGTHLGATSDIQGHFELPAIPPGRCQLQLRLIGYAPLTQELQVAPGSPLSLELRLSPRPIHLGELLIQSDRSFSSASAQAVRGFDLQVRPRASAQQLLQLAPGLVIAQHAGGGKAEQIFLRGFDADHGTDVAVSVDNMPVNMVSHGHGQGYADLHFVIPETIEDMEVFKGPYAAQFGNLATAGAISFHTRDHLPENMVRLGGGQLSSEPHLPGAGPQQLRLHHPDLPERVRLQAVLQLHPLPGGSGGRRHDRADR